MFRPVGAPPVNPLTFTVTTLARFLLPLSAAVHRTYPTPMEQEKSFLTWDFWGWSVPWRGLRTQSDHPEIQDAPLTHKRKSPLLWVFSHTLHKVPREKLFCLPEPVVSGRSLMVLAEKWRYLSGNTANLKTTGCSRDTCLKKVLVSFVIFADLDSL